MSRIAVFLAPRAPLVFASKSKLMKNESSPEKNIDQEKAIQEPQKQTARKSEHVIRSAHYDDLDGIQALLEPFVQARKLLKRLESELILLMANGFVAEQPASATKDGKPKIVGFAAVEIYSRKLGEIQCLAVDDDYQGRGIGSELVRACVERARKKGILEVMAISASDDFLRKLGFDYSLPEQKRALFFQLHSRDDLFRDTIGNESDEDQPD